MTNVCKDEQVYCKDYTIAEDTRLLCTMSHQRTYSMKCTTLGLNVQNSETLLTKAGNVGPQMSISMLAQEKSSCFMFQHGTP
jgi:hypothetical protein